MANPETDINTLAKLAGLASFEAASSAVIDYLRDHVDVGSWMATRVNGPNQFVLSGESENYGLKPGASLPWADTFCHRMVEGKGPNIATNVANVPVYAESPLMQYAPVGSYVGVPINTGSGELFGTLCALNPEPQQHNVDSQLPLIGVLAQLLGSIATLEISALRHSEHIETLTTAAFSDALTGVANRNGWEQHLLQVQSTVSSLGSPVGIFIVDLDEMKLVNDTHGHAQGDELLKQTATILRATVRNSDLVARIGGDEFAIATLECTEQRAQQLEQELNESLKQQGIRASIGYAWHQPWREVADTVKAADSAMYAAKNTRQKKSPEA